MSTEKNKGKSVHVSPKSLPSGLASPARRALAAAGITQLDQFAAISEAELLKLHGMGPKAVEIIRKSMQENGLSFAVEGKSAKFSEKTNQRIERRVPK
jgi:DNA-directed RNA polymerase alpha subunit